MSKCVARALVLLAAFSGCRSEPSAVVDIKLIELIRPQVLIGVPATIDLGTPAAAPFLSLGWSEPDRTPAGETVAWLVGPSADLRLAFDSSADRTMIIRAAAPGGRRQTVLQLRLNHRPLGSVQLTPQMSEHAVELPARLQGHGENILTLAAGSRRAPAGREPKRIVAVDAIRWPAEKRSPRISLEKNGLSLLPPAESRFYLRVPDEAKLAFTAANVSPETSLSARIQVADGGEQALLLRAEAGPQAVDLHAFAGQLAEIRLASHGSGPPVLLQHPHVSGRARAENAPLAGVTAPRANVVLYIVDTLRADHLGCYGYARPTSPRIDAFAAGATLFESMIAQSSWTRPAVASLMTGLNPPSHWALSLRDSLRPDVPTLAQSLQSSGYRTAAFVTNFNVSNRWGFDRGFDDFRYLPEDERSANVHVGADVLNREALDWLRRHRAAKPSQPFFLWMHATDPHTPYVPPEPLARRFRRLPAPTRVAKIGELRDHPDRITADDAVQLVDGYDAEIAFVDHAFGELLSEIESLGLADDTVIILTADHGEEFLDHGGLEHGRTLYQEQLNVPFIMRVARAPGAGARISTLVRQIDLMPTLLQLLSVPTPPGLEGRSLIETNAGAEGAFAQTSLGYRETRAFVSDGWKVIEDERNDRHPGQAYDLVRDPKEQDDRASSQSVRLGYARQEIAAIAVGAPGSRLLKPAATLDAATEERLRSLGYAD
jgi:arylsulfatase A-like enzyme